MNLFQFVFINLIFAYGTSCATVAVCGAMGSLSHMRPAVLTGLAMADRHKVVILGPDPVLATANKLGAQELKRISLGDHDLFAHQKRTFKQPEEKAQEFGVLLHISEFLTYRHVELLGSLKPALAELKPAVMIAECMSLSCLEAADAFNIPVVSGCFGVQSMNPGVPAWRTGGMGTEPLTTKDVSLWSRMIKVTKIFSTLSIFKKAEAIQNDYRKRHGLEPKGMMDIIGKVPIATIHNTFYPLELAHSMPSNRLLAGPMVADPTTRQPLSTLVSDFLDTHKNVIYMALGQHWNVVGETKPFIIKSLQRVMDDGLADGVIWIIKDDDPKDYQVQDSRILLEKWTTQASVLEHASVKLFISHCGADSTNEGVLAGVPMLGTPTGGDQPSNAMRLSRLGVGEWVHISDISGQHDQFYPKLQQVLRQSSYRTQMTKLSQVAKANAAAAPAKVAAFVESIIQFGPEAVMDYGRQFGWLKRHNYDVWLAYASVIASFVIGLVLVKNRLISRSTSSAKPKMS